MQALRVSPSMVLMFVLRGKNRRRRPMAFSMVPFCQAVGIAEEGLDAEPVDQDEVLSELGAVVEGDGLAQLRIDRGETSQQALGRREGGFARLLGGQYSPGFALLRNEDGLAGGCEQHEVGLPMSEGVPELDLGGARSDGNAAFYQADGGATGAAAAAALELGSGQVMAPGAVVGAADLIIDEAIDALMADAGRGLGAVQPTGDLLGRPAAAEATQDEVAQLGIAFQARALPAAGGSLLLGVGRLVADLRAAIALQLARDARWRAIQSCRDLAQRMTGLVKLGNLAALFQAELAVVFAHCNTLSWCCTSFVNSGGPLLRPQRSPGRWGCRHPHPPQIRTCRFPASGSSPWRFAQDSIAMDDAGLGERVVLEEHIQALPAECVAPPAQPSLPGPHELMPVPSQPSHIARHAVVGVVASRHRTQMTLLLPDRLVQVMTAPVAHRRKPAREPAFGRHLPHHVVASPRLAPDMGEAQEVERRAA